MHIDVSYNHASKIGGNTWSSGSTRFLSQADFIKWLQDRLSYGPVLITNYVERRV